MRSGFEITFTETRFWDEGGGSQPVRLMFGEWTEVDLADLTCWSIADYEKQWLEELVQVLGLRSRGALITSVHDPAYAFQVRSWPMWRQQDVIHFQSRILFMLEEKEHFDQALVSEHVAAHERVDEDGNMISEWTVPVCAIQDF